MPRPTSILAGLLALLSCASCRVVDARVHNLDELHGEDGRHRYSAALMTDIEYLMRIGLVAAIQGFGKQMELKEPSKVDDPASECLENVLALAACNSDDPDALSAQVELFSRMANRDPWRLSRERCVRELGELARRLELDDRERPTTEQPVATVEQVRDALAQLISASGPYIGTAARAPGDVERLQAACDRIVAMDVDVDAGVRLLRGARLVLERAGRGGEAGAPLGGLERHLQRRCATLALIGARSDLDPWVRAAAVHGNVQAFGGRGLESALTVFAAPSPDDVVVLAVLAALERRKLADFEGADDDENLRIKRETIIEDVYRFATRHPEGRVRTAAMRTLGVLTDADVGSLREEDWQRWWLARQASQRAGAPPAEATQGPRP